MKHIGRLLRVGFLSFLVGCLVSPIQPELNPSIPYNSERYKKIEEEKRKTVALVFKDDDGILAYCAGVWIKQGIILTANHCVENIDPIVFYSTEQDYKAKKTRMALVAAADEKNDLALLFVDPTTEPAHENINIETAPALDVGQDIDIIGHTSGYAWSYARGQISALREDVQGPQGITPSKIVQVSAPVWMGNSGGGAYDGNGNFIGLCSWISRRGPFLAFFIHRDTIQNFLAGKESPI